MPRNQQNEDEDARQYAMATMSDGMGWAGGVPLLRLKSLIADPGASIQVIRFRQDNLLR